jgi:hypothetical protein
VEELKRQLEDFKQAVMETAASLLRGLSLEECLYEKSTLDAAEPTDRAVLEDYIEGRLQPVYAIKAGVRAKGESSKPRGKKALATLNSKEEAMRKGREPAEFSAAMREASSGRLRNGPLQQPEPSRSRDRESFFHCIPDPARPWKFGRLGPQAREASRGLQQKWHGRIPPAARLEGEAAMRRLIGKKCEVT